MAERVHLVLRGAPRPGRRRRAAVAREPDRGRHRRVRRARRERRGTGATRRAPGGRPEILVLRVDRTDPSKNAVRGFEAFGRLLEREPALHGRIALLALLDPSRQEIPEYVDYRRGTEEAAAAVNGRFGTDDWLPVRLDVRDDFLASVAAYVEYDVLLINPVMDGLNLVAKEAPLVNGRDGVLVLSREAGAFSELDEWAIGVDPLDVDEQAAALARAITLPPRERRARARGHSEPRRGRTTSRRGLRELEELRPSALARGRALFRGTRGRGYDARVSVGPDVVAQELVSVDPATLEAVGRVPVTPPEELAEVDRRGADGPGGLRP